MVNSNQKKKSESFEILSGQKIESSKKNFLDNFSKSIAFYLPQFHRIPENSEWWGEGFTEWNNAVRGRPNFKNHYQPHLPRELGFYDLSRISVMNEQVEMAKIYGLKGFCFYYYWFSGKKILEEPINNFLKSKINFEFCLCWANENWTRTWDGEDQKVLLKQNYKSGDPENFIKSLFPFFNDKRYIRINDKPVILVYRAKDIPNVKDVFNTWRTLSKENGFSNIHIIAVDFYDIHNPNEVNADALVEFPPHKFNGVSNGVDEPPKLINKNWVGSLVDYRKVVIQSINRKTPNYKLYRSVMPSWDNSARRPNSSTIVHGSDPELFENWIRYIRSYTLCNFKKEERFIFINAWNEWGEGCHLEPDQEFGLKYLEALLKSASSKYSFKSLEIIKKDSINFLKTKIKDKTEKKVFNDSQKTFEIKLKAKTLTIKINLKYFKDSFTKKLNKFPLMFKLMRRFYNIYKRVLRYIFYKLKN